MPICFIFFILLIATTVDSNRTSTFIFIESDPRFTSPSSEKNVWSSRTREFCFARKELSFELQEEFSPMPIPTFKIKNAIPLIYISVDIDEAYPVRFQELIDAWEAFSRLQANEQICFQGAYLPPENSQDAAYIMIEKIKSKNLKLALKDFLMALD